jgi:predicted RNA-binding Zn ribbon-like protein
VSFAHDTDVVLASAAALANSASDGETLATPADLDRFVAQHQWTGSRTHDRAELEAVHALRVRLRRWWTCSEQELVEEVNAVLREGQALPQVVDHDGFGWHIHAVRHEAPLATRMAVEAAMGFVDVLRSGELDRLKTCAAEDCDDVVVDLSRNRSRRFCDSGCGNRENVRAYRDRQRS